MIRLSAFSDEAGKELSVQIEALLRNKIYLTELRAVGGKNVKDLTLDEAKAIGEELKKNGIALSALGSPMGKVDITVDFEAYLEDVRHMCELAQVLGTDRIRMFSFYNAYESRETVIAYLKRMVEVAKEYGITLCHENEKKIYGDTVDRMLDLYENVPGLAFVYDPANFLQCDEMPEKTLPALHGLVKYFHIKDVIHETGALVPAGYGNGQIDTLVKMIDRDTILTLEPHLKVFSGYNEIDGEEMKHAFHFTSSGEAFDAAVAAMKKILTENGYVEENGGFVKK
jgi:sugar phosphate isomerase/epimerase